MWTPWSARSNWSNWSDWSNWGRRSNDRAVANARSAAIECSRALAERMEIELYVEELVARRERPPITA